MKAAVGHLVLLVVGGGELGNGVHDLILDYVQGALPPRLGLLGLLAGAASKERSDDGGDEVGKGQESKNHDDRGQEAVILPGEAGVWQAQVDRPLDGSQIAESGIALNPGEGLHLIHIFHVIDVEWGRKEIYFCDVIHYNVF